MQPLSTQHVKKIEKFTKFCNKLVIIGLLLHERMKMFEAGYRGNL